MHKIIPKKIRDERGDGDDDSFSDEIEENQWELVCVEGVVGAEGVPQKAVDSDSGDEIEGNQ